ncbi:MAG: permease prefix domain 1-containing protein [Trebonia sp.]
MTSAAPPPRPGTGRAAESYLAEVAARLPGPGRSHAGIIAELRAGLLDATDAHRSAGLPPAEAAAAAVSEFGDPRLVAAAFGPELAARSARRTALTLIATGPVIGVLWASAAMASRVGVRHAPPWQWAGAPPGSLFALPLAAAVIAVTVWASLITIAATGRLTRWLPRRPRLAPAAAAAAGFGAATADVIILVLLASQLVHAPGTLSPVPVAAAATASLTRLALARHAARRCLTVRAALT